jgi:hypothetical protein
MQLSEAETKELKALIGENTAREGRILKAMNEGGDVLGTAAKALTEATHTALGLGFDIATRALREPPLTKAEWTFLAWNTFHCFEAIALRITGGRDLTDRDRAAWKDIEGLLDRLGAPYGLNVEDVINGFTRESCDPPSGNERLASYIGRPKLYEMSREELAKMSPEDVDRWPSTEHAESVSEQADLRKNCCRIAGILAIRRSR